MKIPMGNFGFAVPQVQRTGTVGSMENAGATGAALADIGNTGMKIASKLQDEQNAEQKRIDEEARKKQADLEKTRALKADVDFKDAVATTFDETVAAVGRGEMNRTDAAKQFVETMGKRRTDLLSGLSPDVQPHVSVLMDSTQNTFNRNLLQALDQHRMQEIAGNAEYIRDSMMKQAGRPGADIAKINAEGAAVLRTLYQDAGFKPEAVEKKVQGFQDENTFNYLDRAVSQAQNNSKELALIAKDIGEEKYSALDPQKRNFLEAKIQRNQQHLMQKAEIAERRRMTNLNTMANRLSWYVENGRDIPTNEFNAFTKASKGTPMEGFAQQITAEQKAVSEFTRLSPTQMQAKVQELAASYGATPTKEQITHLAKIDKFVQNSMQMLRSTPLEYAVQREGAIVDPLDFAKMDTWASNLANRTAILIEQSKRNGTEPKGLLKQEAAALASFMAGASDTAKTEALKLLRKGFGDDKVFRATMQQIAPDSPVTALAGMIATRERPMKIGGWFSDETFTPGSTAGLLLAGERLLNPGKDAKGQDGKPTFPMPKDADLRLKFNSMAGEAFAGNPEAMQITYQATRAAYAALTAQKGDYSGTLSESTLTEAIQRATGGVADVNGGVVIKPWGMDDSTFRNVAKTEFRKAVEQAGMPQMKDQWPRLRLQNTKGGYFVKSGTGYLLGKDGNPVLVKISDPNEPSGMADRIPK